MKTFNFIAYVLLVVAGIIALAGIVVLTIVRKDRTRRVEQSTAIARAAKDRKRRQRLREIELEDKATNGEISETEIEELADLQETTRAEIISSFGLDYKTQTFNHLENGKSDKEEIDTIPHSGKIPEVSEEEESGISN